MPNKQNMSDLQQLKHEAESNDPKAQFQLALALFRAEQSDVAWTWLDKSANQQFQPALFQKAMLLALGQTTDADINQAIVIFEQLARRQNPDAMRTLANLYGCGLVVGNDWTKAKEWFLKAFMMGHKAVIREAAILLASSGYSDMLWMPLLRRVAVHGDVAAKFHLGTILMTGGKEDVEQGRWFLHEAEKEGHPWANEALAGEEAPETTPPGANQEIPVDLPTVIEALKSLNPPKLGETKQLYTTPESYIAQGFFTDMECDHLKAAAVPFLNPAIVYNTNELREETNPVRTNESATFHLPQQDFVINWLTRKIAAFSNEPLENAEQLVVLKYLPGEEYLPHFDYLDPRVPGLKEEVERNGQRVKTVLVYLNDNYTGGETRFVETNKDYKGAKGDALLFYNVTVDGRICPESQHAGLPILEGVKWLAVKWIRNKPQKKLT